MAKETINDGIIPNDGQGDNLRLGAQKINSNFDELYNVIFIQSSKKVGLFFWKSIDVKIIDKFGPDGISSLIKTLSIKASKFQSGFIYQYAFMILIGFSALLTFLILK